MVSSVAVLAQAIVGPNGIGLVGNLKTFLLSYSENLFFSTLFDIVSFRGNSPAMSFTGSSMDLVLAEDWSVARPSFMMPGFVAQRPTSILDFTLQDGPINVMSLDSFMGSLAMQWVGLVPALPPPRESALPQPDPPSKP